MKNVPKLRFRGFDGEWEQYKVGSIFDRIKNPVDVKNDENYKQIGIRSHGKGIFYKEPITGEQLGNKRVFWIEPNVFIVNIVFAWERAVARTTNNEVGMIASHRFPMYKPKDNILDLDFITHFFITNRGQRLLESASPGGAGRNKTLGQKEFDNLLVTIPTLQEQQRIADFLTKVDKLIEKQDEKVKNLELYKKGMMQKIFSQKIRFRGKNGEEFPEWEEKKLGDFLTFYNTNSYSRDCLNNNYGSVKNIHYGDIHMKFSTIVDVTNTHIPYINEDIDISKIPEESFCKDGDIVIADASEDYDDIGKTIELKNIGNERIVAGLHTILARDTKNVIYNGYAGYMFLDEKVRKQIKILAAGAKVLGISKNNIVKVTVKLPSREEQRKIVNFLYKIDCLVEKEKSKLESLTKWKKGLLQKMFV